MVLGLLVLFAVFYCSAGELEIFSKSLGAVHIKALFLDFDGSEGIDCNPVVVVLFIGSLM